MDTTGHIPVGLLLILLTSCMSPIMADFNTVKNSCSKPCQLTVDYCKQEAQLKQPLLTNNCDLIQVSLNGVSAYQCLVKNGFCTENEFVKLKNEACGLFGAQKTVSTATSVFYEALSLTTESCQRQALTCVQGSSVATVLKQQEHYCDLVNIATDVSSSQICLTTSGCSFMEYNRIGIAACSSSTAVKSQYARAVMEASQKCKGAMETCSASSDTALALIQSEQYCQAMTINNQGKTTKMCLVDSSKCTQSEFDNLKIAACGVVPDYSFLSQICQLSVDHCKHQAQYFNPGLTDACTLLKSTYNEVSAFQCLVKTGFCTENEFVKMRNDACGLYEAQQKISAAKTMLYRALSTATDVCQRRALECVIGSRVATVLKQQEKYCALMDISTDVSNSQRCLTASNGCSSAEFNAIKTAACSSTPTTQSDFSNAIIASSKKCKGAMEQCTESNDIANALIQSEQYCKVMSIQNNGVTTYSCLVDSTKCSQAEFDALKLAACGVIPGYASVSKLCQITVDSCRSKALFLNPELTDTCQLLKSTFNGVTAFHCLVNIGFCTDSEYSSLVKDSCGSSDDQITASDAKTSLYNTLNSTAESCQRSALLCIQGSSVATVMKQEENFCDMWKMFNDVSSLRTCMTTSGCSSEVFNSITRVSCSSSPPVSEGRFANAVVSTTSGCKVALETCTSSSDTSLSLIQKGEYCKVMTINTNGVTTETCLVADSRCTKSEFDSLKRAACTGVSVYANCLLLLISISAAFL